MKYVLLIGLFFCSCNSQKSSEQYPELIGKTIAYTYGDNIYHVFIDTDSTLQWEAITGDEKGVVGYEKYISVWLESRKLFITWGEESGTGVSQVLDFNKGKVYNHLLFGRELSKGEGRIQIID